MPPTQLTAFCDTDRIASGGPLEVAAALKAALESQPARSLLVFDDATGEQVDLDLRGSPDEVFRRFEGGKRNDDLADPQPRSVGRPKIGVVAHEVNLLPQQWTWLSAQPGGASATLRRLVAQARRVGGTRAQVQRSQEATFRFLSAIAGNLPGFEEACRGLYRRDRTKFAAEMASWPRDIRSHATKLASAAFDSSVSIPESPGSPTVPQ